MFTCICTNCANSTKDHKTRKMKHELALPVSAINSLNISNRPHPLSRNAEGLCDQHVLKTNITLGCQSCYLESSLFLLDFCYKVTEVRGRHAACCAVAVLITGKDVKEEGLQSSHRWKYSHTCEKNK